MITNMDEARITKAMERALKARGLTADDLTVDQLKRLHEETKLRRMGIHPMDGVLFGIGPIMKRKSPKKETESPEE